MSDKPESVRMHRNPPGTLSFDSLWWACWGGCDFSTWEHADFVPAAALRAAEEETKETKAAWLRTLVETGEEMNRLDAQLAAVTARAEKAEEALELVAPAIHHAMCGVSIHVAACDTIRAALASAPEEKKAYPCGCPKCSCHDACAIHAIHAPAEKVRDCEKCGEAFVSSSIGEVSCFDCAPAGHGEGEGK